MEHLNDFSPSLINDRNELSTADKYDLMRMQAIAKLGVPHLKQPSYSLGITSVDQEKSVSLLDSIAIKEEDSTEKKYIATQQSSSSCVEDHGGNEQTNSDH